MATATNKPGDRTPGNAGETTGDPGTQPSGKASASRARSVRAMASSPRSKASMRTQKGAATRKRNAAQSGADLNEHGVTVRDNVLSTMNAIRESISGPTTMPRRLTRYEKRGVKARSRFELQVRNVRQRFERRIG